MRELKARSLESRMRMQDKQADYPVDPGALKRRQLSTFPVLRGKCDTKGFNRAVPPQSLLHAMQEGPNSQGSGRCRIFRGFPVNAGGRANIGG